MSFPFELRDAGGLPQEDTTKMHYLDLRMRLEDKESPVVPSEMKRRGHPLHIFGSRMIQDLVN